MESMKRCTVVVVLITGNTLLKQFPWSEVGAARAFGKIIIPVVVDVEIPSVVQDLFCIWLSNDKIGQAAKKISGSIPVAGNKRVFVVHGHNEAKKLELKGFLLELGLTPIVLHEQDDLGKTIIEKFEHYSLQSAFAFVLLTPDDVGAVANSDESKWQARQNVILELGYFMARLGREKVVLLHKGEVEIPSDILGIIDLRFENSVLEVGEKIRQRLKGAGLIK